MDSHPDDYLVASLLTLTAAASVVHMSVAVGSLPTVEDTMPDCAQA